MVNVKIQTAKSLFERKIKQREIDSTTRSYIFIQEYNVRHLNDVNLCKTLANVSGDRKEDMLQ